MFCHRTSNELKSEGMWKPDVSLLDSLWFVVKSEHDSEHPFNVLARH